MGLLRAADEEAVPFGEQELLAGVRAGSDLGRIQLNRGGRRVDFHPGLGWIARPWRLKIQTAATIQTNTSPARITWFTSRADIVKPRM